MDLLGGKPGRERGQGARGEHSGVPYLNGGGRVNTVCPSLPVPSLAERRRCLSCQLEEQLPGGMAERRGTEREGTGRGRKSEHGRRVTGIERYFVDLIESYTLRPNVYMKKRFQ